MKLNKIKFFLLFGLSLYLLSFVTADSNGIWHFTKDIRFGHFGMDEDGYMNSSIYYFFDNPVSFTSLVIFNGFLQSNVDFNLNGNLNISKDIYFSNNSSNYNCSKLYTNQGKINCGIDNVDDNDNDPSNELPIAGYGTLVSTNTVSVDTSKIATIAYVNNLSINCSTRSNSGDSWTYLAKIGDGTVSLYVQKITASCNTDEILVGCNDDFYVMYDSKYDKVAPATWTYDDNSCEGYSGFISDNTPSGNYTVHAFCCKIEP